MNHLPRTVLPALSPDKTNPQNFLSLTTLLGWASSLRCSLGKILRAKLVFTPSAPNVSPSFISSAPPVGHSTFSFSLIPFFFPFPLLLSPNCFLDVTRLIYWFVYFFLVFLNFCIESTRFSVTKSTIKFRLTVSQHQSLHQCPPVATSTSVSSISPVPSPPLWQALPLHHYPSVPLPNHAHSPLHWQASS